MNKKFSKSLLSSNQIESPVLLKKIISDFGNSKVIQNYDAKPTGILKISNTIFRQADDLRLQFKRAENDVRRQTENPCAKRVNDERP